MASDVRKRHGVYATPPQLVSFVVRSVHFLLQCNLGLADGLADRRVRLLDPAAGALNFVIEAWRVALDLHRQTRERGRSRFIREHLLPHFHGIELRQEACEEGQRAAAGFFEDEGCPLGPDERASLHHADALAGPLPDLSDGIPVVIGNPPWSGFRTHKGRWIRDLLHGYVLPGGTWEEGYYRVDGRRLEERNTKWLQDEYVKFLRLAQWTIDRAGEGIAALVLNHNCLDAPTFAGLRSSIGGSFCEVHALDLHGNRRKGELAPKGGIDENVFPGVSQGAAVLFLVKKMGKRRRLFRADLYGSRKEKLSMLSTCTFPGVPWVELPTSLPCTFQVQDQFNREEEYRRGVLLPEIFHVYSQGVVTGCDASMVALDPTELEERFPEREPEILPFLVRPFDRRFLAYSEGLLARPRLRVMSHLRAAGNIALLALRQAGSQGAAAFVTRVLPGHKVLAGYHPNSVFPLYLLSRKGERLPNLAPAFCEALGDLLGSMPAPEEILGYVYAVLYHPAYQARYHRELWLSNDFPRIPWPASKALFKALARLGTRLVKLHLLEDASASLRFDGDTAAALSERPALEKGRLQLAEGFWAEGIGAEVWSYRIGGYAVLERWLRSRAGRRLTPPELAHLGQIEAALRSTLEIRKVLDRISD